MLIVVILLGLILLLWWWTRLMEKYQPKDVPSQYAEDVDYHWYIEQHKTYLVYGHTKKGKGKIVEVDARNGAEALNKAREEHPDCKFSHVNLK